MNEASLAEHEIELSHLPQRDRVDFEITRSATNDAAVACEHLHDQRPLELGDAHLEVLPLPLLGAGRSTHAHVLKCRK